MKLPRSDRSAGEAGDAGGRFEGGAGVGTGTSRAPPWAAPGSACRRGASPAPLAVHAVDQVPLDEGPRPLRRVEERQLPVSSKAFRKPTTASACIHQCFSSSRRPSSCRSANTPPCRVLALREGTREIRTAAAFARSTSPGRLRPPPPPRAASSPRCRGRTRRSVRRAPTARRRRGGGGPSRGRGCGRGAARRARAGVRAGPGRPTPAQVRYPSMTCRCVFIDFGASVLVAEAHVRERAPTARGPPRSRRARCLRRGPRSPGTALSPARGPRRSPWPGGTRRARRG